MPETTENWLANQGGFWGTPNQLLRCARCGDAAIRGRHEPVKVCDLFKPSMHFLCDDCFDQLPE